MSPRTRVAIGFLNANLDRVISVADVAQSVRLSRSRLSYLFAIEVGISPTQYLKRLRLETACQLLETSLLSVKEVAAKVGYNDCTHFVRDFKKVYGTRPSQYRASHLSSRAVKE
jgi:transcriptional regulator GlxA family with amidase domain